MRDVIPRGQAVCLSSHRLCLQDYSSKCPEMGRQRVQVSLPALLHSSLDLSEVLLEHPVIESAQRSVLKGGGASIIQQRSEEGETRECGAGTSGSHGG